MNLENSLEDKSIEICQAFLAKEGYHQEEILVALEKTDLPVVYTYVPGMGYRIVDSTSGKLLLSADKAVPVTLKPFERYSLARREFVSAERAHIRLVPTPCAIALIRFEERKGILVLENYHSAAPLSLKDSNEQIASLWEKEPEPLLKEMVTAIASIHEQGIIHGNLHLGRVGYDFSNDRKSPIFFGWDSARFLTEIELAFKKNISSQTGIESKLESFERLAVEELGMFLGHLSHNQLLPEGRLLEVATQRYLHHRSPSSRVIKGRPFRQKLWSAFSKTKLALS